MRPARVLRNPRYQRLKLELPVATRHELDLLEESIIVDPVHRARRSEREDGTVVDFSSRQIFLMFAMRGDTLVFIDFLELEA